MQFAHALASASRWHAGVLVCVCVYVCVGVGVGVGVHVWVCVGVYLVNRWHPGTFWRNIGAVVAAGAGRPGI